jgi:membrane protein involved in colicin uptake
MDVNDLVEPRQPNRAERRWNEKRQRALDTQKRVAEANRLARERAKEAQSSSEVAIDAALQAERHAANVKKRLAEADAAERARIEAIQAIEAAKAAAASEAKLAAQCLEEAREAAQDALAAVERARHAATLAENLTRGI